MNIFFLDEHPGFAAIKLKDQHIISQLRESCQLLCTWAGPKDFDFWYKSTHVNHPCNKWLRESTGNVYWLLEHTTAIIREYDFRFGKEGVFEKPRLIVPKILDILFDDTYYPITKPALAMPDEYKADPHIDISTAVESYRYYYLAEKMEGARYTNRDFPDWN
jgi:hypothetical protein